MTLFDFSDWTNLTSSGPAHVCRVYATVREGAGGKGATVCGGQGVRPQRVYITTTNTVEVRIITGGKRNNADNFLIKYEGKELISGAFHIHFHNIHL